MELEEYVQQQKENYKLFTNARSSGEEWWSHEESSKIMDQMIELEKNFFLEHFEEYADLLETKMNKNGTLEVKGPDGSYMFTLALKENERSNLTRTLDTISEKLLGNKPQRLEIADDNRNSNSIKWGSESTQEVSEILNHTLLLESKFISKKNVESDSAENVVDHSRTLNK